MREVFNELIQKTDTNTSALVELKEQTATNTHAVMRLTELLERGTEASAELEEKKWRDTRRLMRQCVRAILRGTKRLFQESDRGWVRLAWILGTSIVISNLIGAGVNAWIEKALSLTYGH